MARPWLRVRALLTAALILFIHVRGWAGEAPCPRHSSEQHAASAHHHGHADHAHPGDSNGKPCTCMDDCPACQAIAAAPPRIALPESPIVLTRVALVAPPWIHLSAPIAHQLPLSTAPPVAG